MYICSAFSLIQLNFIYIETKNNNSCFKVLYIVRENKGKV